jgi:hypothetical protein
VERLAAALAQLEDLLLAYVPHVLQLDDRVTIALTTHTHTHRTRALQHARTDARTRAMAYHDASKVGAKADVVGREVELAATHLGIETRIACSSSSQPHQGPSVRVSHSRCIAVRQKGRECALAIKGSVSGRQKRRW